MQDHIIIRYLENFKDPLIVMLLISACLSVLIGQYEDACSIVAAVVIVGTVGFVQEYNSEKSLEALSNLVPPRCNVLRNGNLININAENIVPGDIVKLNTGDRVPADMRIIVSNGLSVDESSLTGECEPKDKITDALINTSDNIDNSDKHNMV